MRSRHAKHLTLRRAYRRGKIKTRAYRMSLPDLSSCAWTATAFEDLTEVADGVVVENEGASMAQKERALYDFVDAFAKEVQSFKITSMEFQSSLRKLKTGLRGLELTVPLLRHVNQQKWKIVWNALLEVFKKLPPGAPEWGL